MPRKSLFYPYKPLPARAVRFIAVAALAVWLTVALYCMPLVLLRLNRGYWPRDGMLGLDIMTIYSAYVDPLPNFVEFYVFLSPLLFVFIVSPVVAFAFCLTLFCGLPSRKLRILVLLTILYAGGVLALVSVASHWNMMWFD